MFCCERKLEISMNNLVVDLMQQGCAVEKSSNKGVTKRRKSSSAHIPNGLGKIRVCASSWTCSSSPGGHWSHTREPPLSHATASTSKAWCAHKQSLLTLRILIWTPVWTRKSKIHGVPERRKLERQYCKLMSLNRLTQHTATNRSCHWLGETGPFYQYLMRVDNASTGKGTSGVNKCRLLLWLTMYMELGCKLHNSLYKNEEYSRGGPRRPKMGKF